MLKICIASICVAAVVAGCGSSGPSADKVAQEAGASLCAESGYGIQYRTDNSQHTIYNCEIGGSMVCVTLEAGIAKNVTAAARLIFAGSLGGKRPDCLKG